MKKKLLCTMLSAVMLFSAAACTSDAGTSSEPAPTSEAVSSAEASEEAEDLGYTFGDTCYSEEPVKYSMAFSDASWYPMTDQWKTDGVFAKIKELTNNSQKLLLLLLTKRLKNGKF